MPFLGGVDIPNPLAGLDRMTQGALGMSLYAALVVVLLIALLVYVVNISNQADAVAKKLGAESMTSGAVDINGYASRLPVEQDHGLTSAYTTVWGNPLTPNKQKDGFLGSHESPVFYDIGDVRQTIAARSQKNVRGDDQTDAATVTAAQLAAAKRLVAAQARIEDAQREGAEFRRLDEPMTQFRRLDEPMSDNQLAAIAMGGMA